MAAQLPTALVEILRGFDSRDGVFTLAEVYDAVNAFAKGSHDLSPDETLAVRAEIFAFFLTGFGGEGSEWGTHFGPILGPFKLENIPADVIPHWSARIDEVRHPVLKAHYADLVWDLALRLTSTKPAVLAAQVAIDCYILAAQRWPGIALVIYAVHWLERALALAQSINDPLRTEAAKRAMFELSDRFFEPSEVNTWYFLFDRLLDNKRLLLAQAEKERVIERLERVLRHATVEVPDHFVAQAAGERLARFYRKTGAVDAAKRAVSAYAGAFEQAAEHVDPLHAMSLLEPAHEAYRLYGLAEEERRVQLKLKEKGLASHQSMVTISLPVEIPRAEWDAYVEQLTAGSLDDALRRVARRFVPDANAARSVLREMQDDAPLLAILSVAKIADGNVVAKTGSVEEDADGRLRLEIADRIGMDSAFLAAILDRLRERHGLTADQVVPFLAQSPLFDEDRLKIISDGVAAYLTGDHVKASHVLVPQIEAALRTLLGLLGEPTNKPSRGNPGVMQEKNLGDILANEEFVRTCPEDLRLYLSVFLSDPRGHNVRNRLSHGLLTFHEFDRPLTDRLVHVLLVLALFRKARA